jgi:2-succinyl-6-hydroxy-2,4-cyclohexadiene-1-carboxylate synthase
VQAQALPVLLVPGFTQTASSWDAVRTELTARGIPAMALEVAIGDDFAATARGLANDRPAGLWCGYSMGARLALRLAIDDAAAVRGLVLVSGTAGLDESARRERIAADEDLARSIERDGVAAFLDRWLAQPMFAGVPADASGLADRASWSAADLARWLRVCGTGTMEPMWDRLAEISVPVLVVSGTNDPKFDALAGRLVAGIAGARHIRIDCGHAVPLEAPRELARAIHEFHSAIPNSAANTN